MLNSHPPAEIFKCLANEGRLGLLMLIQAQREVCVCEVTSILSLSQPVVSQGLKILKEHGLLVTERRGKWHFYSLDPSIPLWMINLLNELVVEDHAG